MENTPHFLIKYRSEIRAIGPDDQSVRYYRGHWEKCFLTHAPGEDNNIAHDPTNADINAQLSERIDTFFAVYSNPKYN